MDGIISNMDKTFESRVRLGIMSVLMVNDSISFSELKDLLQVTDGNLSSHLTGLEKQNYLEATKQFVGKKPNTTYQITDKGRTAFQQHIEALEKLIKRGK